MGAVLKILDLVIVGAMTLDRARQLRAQVEAMQTAGRDPTEAEWDALFAQIDADSERLNRSL